MFIERVEVHEMVADFVGGVGQHDDEFIDAFGYSFEKQRKAVAGQNGENESDRTAARFCADVFRYLVDGCIVTLRTCDDSFRNGENVSVLNCETRIFVVCGGEKAVHNDFYEVVALFDYRSFDTARNSTDCCHKTSLKGKDYARARPER